MSSISVVGRRNSYSQNAAEAGVNWIELSEPILNLLKEKAPPPAQIVPAVKGKSQSVLQDMIAMLSQSRTAQGLLQEAGEDGWNIETGTLDNHDYHLDVPEKRLILDSSQGPSVVTHPMPWIFHAMLFSLCRALRDIAQEKRHGGFEANFQAESVLLLERVRTADCDLIAVLIAWELRAMGLSGLWRHVLCGGDSFLALGFAASFEKAHNRGLDAISARNSALAETLALWHRQAQRVQACDHEILEGLDAHIAGANDGHTFGSRKAQALDIEILSCLPDRTAYLQGAGHEILANPLYAGLNDPINQAHFLQIMRDSKAVIVEGVSFRDPALAALIFPDKAD
ncbi:MAG: hypothetical protein L6Q57_02130 [Alphaproteobacteria bacterium]|nr:hypothetical protein [Alphaproteobacteria bacterium]